DGPEMTARLAAFRQGLEKRGWSEGRNVRMGTRFAPYSSADHAQGQANELIPLQPDVILAQPTPSVAALPAQTRTIPSVLGRGAGVRGAGRVAAVARPGRNSTGVMVYEARVSGKWLAMREETAPRLGRAALVTNANAAPL